MHALLALACLRLVGTRSTFTMNPSAGDIDVAAKCGFRLRVTAQLVFGEVERRLRDALESQFAGFVDSKS